MSHPNIDAQYPVHYAAIRDVHERYFMAVDRGDVAGVRACFAKDLEATYHQRETMKSLDAMMDQTMLPFFERLKSGAVKVSTHFMGNFRIERLAGVTAETETYAIAIHIVAGTADVARVMSLRYLDRLAYATGGWAITKRVQTLDWNCEVPAGFAQTMATRVMAIR